jgi:hypothetical protein
MRVKIERDAKTLSVQADKRWRCASSVSEATLIEGFGTCSWLAAQMEAEKNAAGKALIKHRNNYRKPSTANANILAKSCFLRHFGVTLSGTVAAPCSRSSLWYLVGPPFSRRYRPFSQASRSLSSCQRCL